MADAQELAGADEREAQQQRLLLDALQHTCVGMFDVLQAGVDVGFTLGVEESGKAEAIDESFDLSSRHGLLLEIHHVDFRAALFEESLRGASGLGVPDAEDLDADHIF